MKTRPTNIGRGELLRAPNFITDHAFSRKRWSPGTSSVGANPPSATKAPEGSQSRYCAAYFLVECLVYIAMLAIILVVVMRGFSHCFDNYRAVRRNSDDIIRVLHVGEQWRADIRAATGSAQLTHSGDAEKLRIPSTNGDVIYSFDGGELHRQAAVPLGDHVLLSNVRSSQMEPTLRAPVTAWSWELELNPIRKDARVRPLFTFEAVAGPANKR